MMDNNFKISLYIRVSTGRQANEGDSLEEQEKELKKFCEYKKYLIHKTHIERGRSAKDTKRPEYQLLLKDIKDKKINAVIVKKLDRLSRSLLDFEEFMKIAQENDVEFISLKENFDTTNAMGKAMFRVALVFAQLEREQNSERVSDVMIYRAEQGLYNGGGIPYGYDVINKELVPHKQERKIIELIFNKFIETKSTSSVARELNILGVNCRSGIAWLPKQVDKTLRKIVYIGKIYWAGQTYEGLHQPLISEEVFNKVQHIFKERQYYRTGRKIKGLLKDLIICNKCGSIMQPNYTKKKNKKIYYYYRCFKKASNKATSCNNYLKMEIVDNITIAQILKHSGENECNQSELKIKTHNENIIKQINIIESEIMDIEHQLEVIKNKKEKYLDSLIANQFQKQERETINAKIEEFSLNEKQMQSIIYKKQYTLSNKQNQLISIEQFKEALIFFRLNYQSISFEQLQNWIKSNIKEIVITDKKAEIKFKMLDF